ncbi:MAG: stage II sporulation protein AA (anti-sigma F factor antagonist) [bacterium]|jgi:stage II sporulation protein AA (anti-sigma F factor antagonist)
MDFDHRMEGDICFISIDGNIALDGTNEVKEYLKTFMEDDSINALVLNFGKVNFIDSSGIGLVVSVFKALQQKKIKFALTELNQKNREIFCMTRLDKILNIIDGDEQALELLKS